MGKVTLFELVSAALPADFDAGRLRAYGPASLWRQKQDLALAYALRKCPAINWQAYLLNNPDLRDKNIEPAAHFLKNGLFEGRKLQIHKSKGADRLELEDRPLISIIVYSRNNLVFLKHSIRSLQNQTLRDIEIIVVDDASIDASARILAECPDSRLKILKLPEVRGLHLARKKAVASSTGQFVMFLNIGGYYLSTACEEALTAILAGYDIVSYEFSWLKKKRGGAEPAWVGIDRALSAVAKNFNAANEQFLRETMAMLPENCIYDGGMCREVFSAMPDFPNSLLASFYEALHLTQTAGKVMKIRKRLAACQDNDMTEGDNLFATALPLLKEALRVHALNDHYEICQTVFFKIMFAAWLAEEDKTNVTKKFNALARQAGICQLLNFCIDNYGEAHELIASQFQYYELEESQKLPRVIGILYSILVIGGAEQVIIDLSRLLTDRGYEVVLFLEAAHPHEEALPEKIRVVYLGSVQGKSLKQHLLALNHALAANPVDVMLFHACYSGSMLWELMLVRFLRIPAILFPHGAFFSVLLRPAEKFNLQAQAAVLRCGDCVSVLSRHEELYYRSQGVNAQCVPNPVRLPDRSWQPVFDFAARRKNIIVFSRLGVASKNVNDCLRVLAEARKTMPAIRMTFVGGFANGQIYQTFNALAAQLGVARNIHLTGWLDDATPYIDKAGVLLSCSYTESFSLTIVEAQARGLPCVMNDIPIMPAMNNDSIIRVPHGDYRKAAAAILKLLNNEKEWLRLAAVAMEKSRQFSQANYLENLEAILFNFKNFSRVTYYQPEDYRIVLRALGFYGGNLAPWLKK